MKQKPNLKQKIHPALQELIVDDKTYKAFKKLAVEMIPTIETTSSMFDDIADDYDGVVDYDDNGNLKPIDYYSEGIDVQDYLKYNAKKSKKVVNLYKKLADMYDDMSSTQKFYVMERLKAENNVETDPKLKSNIDNLVRLASKLDVLGEKYSDVGNDIFGHLDDAYEVVSTLQNSEEVVRNNFTGEQLKLRGNQYLDVLTKKLNEIENDNTLTPVAKNTLKILYTKLARAEFSDSLSGYYDNTTNTPERSYKYQSEQNSLSWFDGDVSKLPLDNKYVQNLLGYDFFDTEYKDKDFEKNVKKIIADRKKGIDTTKLEYTRQFNKVQPKQPSIQQTKLANPKGLPSLVNKVRDNRTQKELPQMKQKPPLNKQLQRFTNHDAINKLIDERLTKQKKDVKDELTQERKKRLTSSLDVYTRSKDNRLYLINELDDLENAYIPEDKNAIDNAKETVKYNLEVLRSGVENGKPISEVRKQSLELDLEKARKLIKVKTPALQQNMRTVEYIKNLLKPEPEKAPPLLETETKKPKVRPRTKAINATQRFNLAKMQKTINVIPLDVLKDLQSRNYDFNKLPKKILDKLPESVKRDLKYMNGTEGSIKDAKIWDKDGNLVSNTGIGKNGFKVATSYPDSPEGQMFKIYDKLIENHGQDVTPKKVRSWFNLSENMNMVGKNNSMNATRQPRYSIDGVTVDIPQPEYNTIPTLDEMNIPPELKRQDIKVNQQQTKQAPPLNNDVDVQKRAELKRINKQYGKKFTDAQYNDAVKYAQQVERDKQTAQQTKERLQAKRQAQKQAQQAEQERVQAKQQTLQSVSNLAETLRQARLENIKNRQQEMNTQNQAQERRQQAELKKLKSKLESHQSYLRELESSYKYFGGEQDLKNVQEQQKIVDDLEKRINELEPQQTKQAPPLNNDVDVIPLKAQTKSTRINNAKQRNVIPQNDNAIPLLSGKELAPTNDYTANWQNDAEQLRQDKLNQRANVMYFDENGNPILDSQPSTHTRQPQVIIDENGIPETRQSWQSRNADILDAVNWSEQEMQRAYEIGVRENLSNNLDTAYYENWLRDNPSAARTPPLSRSEQIRQQRQQRQAQVEQAQRQQTGNTLADLLRQRQQQVMANQQYENDFNQLLEQEKQLNQFGYDTSQIGQGDMAARPSTLAQVGSGVKKAFVPNAPSLVRTPQTLGDIAATNIVKGVGKLNLLDPTNLLVQGINKSGQALTNMGQRIGQAGANAGKAAQLGSKAAGAVPKLVGGAMSGIAKKMPIIAQGISIADALNQGDYAQSEIDNDLNAYLQMNDPQGLQDYIQKVNTNNALNESDTWKSAALRGFVTAGNIVEGLSPLGIYQTATGVKDLYDALSGNGLVDSESMTGLSSLIANQLISDEDAMQFLPKEDKAKWNTLTKAQKDAALNRVRARAVYDKHYMQQAGTAQLGSQFGKSLAQDYQYNNPNMLDQDVFANVRGQLGIKDTSAIPKLQRNALPEINQVFNPAEVDLNPYTVEQVRQFASTQAFNPNLPKNVQDDYMKQAVSLNRQLAPQKTKQYKVDTANTYKSPTAGGVNPLYAQNLGGRNVEVTKPPALDKNALYGDIQTGGQYTQQLLQPYVPQLSKQYQKETLINNIQNQMKALKGGR